MLLFAPESYGHGAVAKPVPRRLDSKLYCPWCVGEHHPGTNPFGQPHHDASLSTPCGGTQRGDATYSPKNYGQYKSVADYSDQEFVAGGSFDATIVLDADHGGEAQWQVCPHSEAETEECFRNHPLTPWIDVHAYWDASVQVSRWKSGEHYPQIVHLPSDVPVGPVTLRWLWICKFTDEIFTSCIDVNISSDLLTPSASPVTSIAPSQPKPETELEQTTAAPTTVAEPEPEPEPEPMTPLPTQRPSPGPTLAPTHVPTTSVPTPVSTPKPTVASSGGAICKAIPGLNRGVSDASCAKCARGYKWWPCNEAHLCQCSSGSLVQRGADRESNKRKARSRFLAPDQAMCQLHVVEIRGTSE